METIAREYPDSQKDQFKIFDWSISLSRPETSALGKRVRDYQYPGTRVSEIIPGTRYWYTGN